MLTGPSCPSRRRRPPARNAARADRRSAETIRMSGQRVPGASLHHADGVRAPARGDDWLMARSPIRASHPHGGPAMRGVGYNVQRLAMLKDNVALVTGVSSGIGRATAELLAQHG